MSSVYIFYLKNSILLPDAIQEKDITSLLFPSYRKIHSILLIIEPVLTANRIILQGVVLRGPSYHISISSLGPLFKYTPQTLTFNDTDCVLFTRKSTSNPLVPCINLFNSKTWLAGYQPFANPDIGLVESIFRNTLLHFNCVLLIEYILQFIDICISILKIFDNSGKV